MEENSYTPVSEADANLAQRLPDLVQVAGDLDKIIRSARRDERLLLIQRLRSDAENSNLGTDICGYARSLIYELEKPFGEQE